MTVAMGKSIATFREEAKKVRPLRIDVVEVQVADAAVVSAAAPASFLYQFPLDPLKAASDRFANASLGLRSGSIRPRLLLRFATASDMFPGTSERKACKTQRKCPRWDSNPQPSR
jgi:hypothetical protein